MPHLSPRTLDWLADHPHDRRFVRSVWDKLTELERSGHYPGAIDALRRVLARHQPTSTGRCRTCRRMIWRRPFPCIVWHQIHCDLLGLFAGASRHLVRNGRPVADLVPAGADSRAAQAQHAARAITQRMTDQFGAPTLAHYRRVYESCGQPWPGDEEIRRRFPVTDAS